MFSLCPTNVPGNPAIDAPVQWYPDLELRWFIYQIPGKLKTRCVSLQRSGLPVLDFPDEMTQAFEPLPPPSISFVNPPKSIYVAPGDWGFAVTKYLSLLFLYESFVVVFGFTPEDENEDNTIDFSENAFIVHQISKRERFKEGVQGIVLSIVSQELVKNQRLKIMHSFTDTWSDIVQKMMISPLYLNSKKNLYFASLQSDYVKNNLENIDNNTLNLKTVIFIDGIKIFIAPW